MTRRALFASLTVWFCFVLLLALLLSPSAGRASGGSNLLQNPGFEEGTEDWSKSPSAATFVVTNTPAYVHNGTWAASLNLTNGAQDEIDIGQYVEGIIGGMPYTLTGWAYKDDPNFGWVKLHLDWRDASSSLLTVDSTLLTEDQAAYQFLSIDSAQAPINATRARIECVAYIQEPNPETPVFFDDLSFTFQGSKVYIPFVVKDY